MLIVGIDPGAHGGVALVEGATLFDVWDMPVYRKKVGKTERARISLPGLLDLMSMVSTIGAECVWVEDVQGWGNQVGSSAFGYGIGAVHMACVAASLRYEVIQPGAWKRRYHLGKDKLASVEKAELAFPNQRDKFRGPKGGKLDGRAEAALIALYGAEKLNGRTYAGG